MSSASQSKADFKLTDTIVREVQRHSEVGRAEIIGTLDELWRERMIRHPVNFSTPELDWWRPVKLGYTRGEKKRMLLALIGTFPVSSGEFLSP